MLSEPQRSRWRTSANLRGLAVRLLPLVQGRERLTASHVALSSGYTEKKTREGVCDRCWSRAAWEQSQRQRGKEPLHRQRWTDGHRRRTPCRLVPHARGGA